MKTLFFSTIQKKFHKTLSFISENLSEFMYHSYSFHPQDEEDIIVKYVNAKGRVGIFIQSKDDNVKSVVNEKTLDFDDLGYIYWSDDQEVIVTNDEFFFSEQEIKRAIINTVASSFNKKGYSHPSVVWSLWNTPLATWVCPPSKTDNYAEEKRNEEIKKKVDFLKKKKMCLALIDTFGEKAVRDITFTGIDGDDYGYMVYDLINATKCGVEVNCWSSQQWGGTCRCNNHPASFDIDTTPMTLEDVKKVEAILSEEKNASSMEDEERCYYEKTTVNGIEISVGWDQGYDEYTLYFPQIQIGEEAREKGVWDQVIRISESLDDAKKIFNLSVEIAHNESDVYKIYEKVFNFLIKNIHGIPKKYR